MRTGPSRLATPSNSQVAEWLRLSLLRLYDRHLAADGRRVRYEALRADPEWQRFMAAAAELQKVRPVCKGRAGWKGVDEGPSRCRHLLQVARFAVLVCDT